MLGARKKHKPSAGSGRTRIRKNDEVIVTTGRDRGKRGKVLRVNPAAGTAIVERVNFLKRATRANRQKNQQGGLLEREAPIRLSNLMLVCPACGEGTRVRTHRTDEGASRACAKCDSEIGSK